MVTSTDPPVCVGGHLHDEILRRPDDAGLMDISHEILDSAHIRPNLDRS